MTCPCGVCEERFVGCHAKCEAYKRWHAERDAEVLARFEERTRDRKVAEYNRENVERYRRRKRK